MTEKQEMYGKILNHYGALSQLAKMAEECNELAGAINKYLGLKLHNPTAFSSDIEAEICSEIADVKNMIAQMDILFSPEQIGNIMDAKNQRTFERMAGK